MAKEKEKLSVKDLVDLAKFSLSLNAFLEGLPEKMTIKQFCLALAKEMDYQREQDIRDGVVDVE